MESSILTPRNPIWVFLIINALSISPANSDSRSSVATEICGASVHSSTSNFIPNFLTVMEAISHGIGQVGYALFNVTTPPPPVYAAAQCHSDLTLPNCAACFAALRTKLLGCLPSTSATVFLDGCFLRYDNRSFERETTNDKIDTVKCGAPLDLSSDDFMRMEFERKVGRVIGRLAEEAVGNRGFAVEVHKGGVEGVYALAQCWRTLENEDCRKCLDAAGSKLRDCAPAAEGRAMFAGCYLRYSTERFYQVNYAAEDDESSIVWIVILGIFSAMALVLIAVTGVYFGHLKKTQKVLHNDISISVHKSGLNFKYETLEKATEFFDVSRKLGQGGAGSVFMGILPDGKTVAVKRLFYNTRQWVDEFFNEVNLISGIDHKNLVKLLGCSIEGPESLLVYEFVPNRSLDQILFDKKNTMNILNWQQRFDIITGTAEGLAHLHGGCGSKIIHRDIKSSNILLGQNLIPKIADFGLARSASPDRTHISTGIAGTLGYMAPEYLIRGQLTEMADVYAFGVLVLEIVCGRKNSAFTLGPSSVLHSVWKLYKENNMWESVDPGLKGSFPIEEASNVLQIGLLCTQASVALRPSMSEVVHMLSDKECKIPSPKQPPFLNASVLNSDDPKFTLNGQITDELSSSYTANSNTIYESISQSTVASEPR